MFIYELFETDDTIKALPSGYASEEDDQSITKISDVRKTRLTLMQLNKLRRLNDVRSLEHESDLKRVSAQYRPAESGGGMGM
jgi:hypothetical protein